MDGTSRTRRRRALRRRRQGRGIRFCRRQLICSQGVVGGLARWLGDRRCGSIALCQGAALHYVRGDNGVKDFDVWSFYAAGGDQRFPARWRGTRDFGPSKFGRYSDDPPQFVGRRVDLLGRSLSVALGADPADALQHHLSARRTDSAKALAAKAVVLIDPPNRLGEVVWPV